MCRRPMHWLGEWLRNSKQSLTRLAPESWKSASVLKLSKTSGMDWGGSVSEIHRLSYIHTCTHLHTDPPQSIPLVFDNFRTLADFQDSSANRAKLCFELLRHSPSQCIGLRHFLETRRLPGFGANRVKPCFYLLGPAQNHSISLRHFLNAYIFPGFRCQYSQTCFTTCAECSN